MKCNWFCLVLSVLIIVLVWWAPSWADWGITVLAAAVLICSFFCGGKCQTPKSKPMPNAEKPAGENQ